MFFHAGKAAFRAKGIKKPENAYDKENEKHKRAKVIWGN